MFSRVQVLSSSSLNVNNVKFIDIKFLIQFITLSDGASHWLDRNIYLKLRQSCCETSLSQVFFHNLNF